MSDRLERKAEFIQALAEYLAGPTQAMYSVFLGYPVGHNCKTMAEQWRKVRQATPLHGYPTVEEAVRDLQEFLG